MDLFCFATQNIQTEVGFSPPLWTSIQMYTFQISWIRFWILFSVLVQESFLKNGKICCLEHPSGSPCQLSWTLSESHPCSSSGLLGSNIYWYLGRIREPGLSHPCPTKLHFHQLAQTYILPVTWSTFCPAPMNPILLQGGAFTWPGEAWWSKGHRWYIFALEVYR